MLGAQEIDAADQLIRANRELFCRTLFNREWKTLSRRKFLILERP
jgi:hypothetical protein